jgi:uncharacterized protein YjdB
MENQRGHIQLIPSHPSLRDPLMRVAIVAALVAAASMASACSGGDGGTPVDPGPPAVSSVTFTTLPLTLNGYGTEAAASVTVAPSGATAAVSWTSGSPGVATVTGNGTSATIRAVSAGTAQITASAGGKSATLPVTVNAVAKTIAISVPGNNSQLVIGQRITLSAAVTGDAGVSTIVRWSTSNAAIATVDAGGMLAGVATGSVIITATSDATPTLSTTAAFTVAEPPRVRSVTVNPTTASLLPEETRTITATVDADSGLARTVQWQTSAASVAAVSTAGVVTAVAPGTATITATSTVDATKFAAVAVTVRTPVVSAISVTAPGFLWPGNTLTARANVTADLGANLALTWSTSNAAAATVSSTGVITGIAFGTATITARSVAFPSISGSVNVTVAPPPPIGQFTETRLGLGTGAGGALPGRFERSFIPRLRSVSLQEAWAVASDFDGMSNAALRRLTSGWQSITVPSSGRADGVTTFGSDAFFATREGDVFKWNGSALETVIALGTRRGPAMAAGDANTLFLGGVNGLTNVTGTTSTNLAVASTQFVDIAAINPNLAFAIGNSTGSAVVRRWNGIAWSTEAFPAASEGTAIWARSATEVYASARTGVFLYNGASWNAIGAAFLANEYIMSLTGCGSATYGSTNLGRIMTLIAGTFTQFTNLAPVGVSNSSISCGSDGVVRIASHDGLIMRMSGTTPFLENWSPYLSSVHMNSPTVTYAAGGSGHVWKFDGTTWQTVMTPGTLGIVGGAGVVLTGIWASPDDQTVLVAGLQGNVVRRIGGTWELMNIGNGRMSKITGLSSTMAWGIGSEISGGTFLNSAVWQYNGTSWIRTATHAAFDIAYTAADFVMTVGELGQIYLWNGSSWTSIPSGTTSTLRHIYLPTANFGIATAQTLATVIRWNGSTWSPLPLGAGMLTSTRVNDVFGVGPNETYVLCEGGLLYRFDGTNWSQVTGYTSLNGLAGAAISGYGIIVGRSGEVLTGMASSSMLRSGVRSQLQRQR